MQIHASFRDLTAPQEPPADSVLLTGDFAGRSDGALAGGGSSDGGPLSLSRGLAFGVMISLGLWAVILALVFRH